MRFLLAVLWVVVFLIVGIPVTIVDSICGLFNKDKMERREYRFVQFGLRCVWKMLRVNPIVKGLDNIPKDTGVLYVGNHQSMMDVILCYTLFPGITGFVAKDTIKKVPLLSTWMKRTYCLFLDRKNPKNAIKTIQKASDTVKEGKSIAVYPEGTRSKTGELAAFKEGSFKIAKKANCPIIPMAISGSRDSFENVIPFAKKNNVYVTFGKPFLISELAEEDAKRVGEYTKGIIEVMLKQINSEK